VDGPAADPASGVVALAESIGDAGMAAAPESVVEVAGSPAPLFLPDTLVSSRNPTISASAPSTAICAIGLSFRALLTSSP
jgi:hypothetical protein